MQIDKNVKVLLLKKEMVIQFKNLNQEKKPHNGYMTIIILNQKIIITLLQQLEELQMDSEKLLMD